MTAEPLAPLVFEFEVACPPERAFALWTGGMAGWWPASHSVSGDPELTVAFEPGVGGRIYERTPAGAEHDWGEVVAWEPPGRVAYRWHLRFAPEEATDVEVTFRPAADGSRTRVRLVHGGWERLGGEGPPRRERNQAGWAGVTPRFVEAADA